MTVPLESSSGDSGSYDGGYNINFQSSKWEKKWVTLPNSTMRVFKWVKISEGQSPQMEREENEIYNGIQHPY